MIFATTHVGVVFAGAFLSLAALAAPAQGCGALSGAGRIIEATDRVDLRLEDGRLLRLAGLDAPEPDFALDRIATQWADKPLRVALLAPGPDRWGRWLADFADADGTLMSDDLIAVGAMRVKPEFETRNCLGERLDAEAVARRLHVGLWTEPDAVFRANDVAAIAAADSRFIIVEGAVKRVGVGRSRVYLDFGGKDGFTVVAPRKALSAFERRGVGLLSLAGRSVRVRGYLDNRFGPRIEVADPALIEPTAAIGGSGSGG